MVGEEVAEDWLGPIQQSTAGPKRGFEITQKAVEEGVWAMKRLGWRERNRIRMAVEKAAPGMSA